MALIPQNIPISFAQGLDLKTDFKQVVPGKFLLLQNAIFTTPGEIRKRNGYTALSQQIDGAGLISVGQGLATFKDELIEFDGSFLYSYSQSNEVWVNKGPLTSMEVTEAPIIRNTYQQTVQDMAQHPDGLQCFTWTDSRGSCRYSIVDSITGQAVVQDQALVSTSIMAKPFAVGQYLIIFYIDTATHHLRLVSIPVVNPLAPNAPIDAATNVNVSNPNYDACMLNNRIYFAYNNSDVGNGISVKNVNQFLVISSAQDYTGNNASVCISIVPDPALLQLWITYYNGTAVRYFVITSTLVATPVTGPTTVETLSNVVRIICYTNNGKGQFWYEVSAALPYNHLIRTNTGTNASVIGTAKVFLRSVGIAAKPFLYLTTVYFTVAYQQPQQPTYFTVTAAGIIVAKEQDLVGGGLLTTELVPESVQVTAGTVSFATLQKDLLTTISGTAYTQTGVTETTLDFTSNNIFYKAEIGNNLQLTGGILSIYDGVNVVESGFNVYPEDISNTNASTGGNLGSASVATQYEYSVTYEWTDNQGQLHRSFPSIPDGGTTINFASGVTTGMVTLTIPTLRLSQKTGVVITVYRTTGNGTVFYQLTNLGINNPLYNDPTVDTVTYTDTASDASIQGNPILYTTGNVVGNDPPPAPALITQYVNRLMLVPSESLLTIWFSEEVIPGTPVQWSALFTLNVDSRGGAITALQQMDSYLLIFKKDRIFYIVGQGPDSTGAQNDYGNAQLITSDSGCINANSIVQTPVGVMYQSEKGIYLMGRNLSVEYIGAPVEYYNSATITSAQLIATTNQVRFTMADNETCLMYDYYMKQWSTFTNHNAVDAVIFENEFTYLNPDGMVLQETPGLFTDNGNFIKLKATTSWLSMAQLQGFQRCYRALFLGNYISPHQLLVGVAYDFDPTQVQQDYVNAGSLFSLTNYGEDSPYGGGSPYGGQFPLYQFRFDFERQQCTAIQFTMEDVQSSNFGEGLSLSGFNLTVGMKKGTNKLRQPNIYS